MHWQEGNKITVTVFPCTPEEVRRFKIGLTIPLRSDNEQLVLSNIAFEGPEAMEAEESTRIEIHHIDAAFIEKPPGFKKKSPQVLIKEGGYNNIWEIVIDKPVVNSNAFPFNGRLYKMHPMSKTMKAYNPDNIFLDINNSWTKGEIDKVLKTCKNKNIYVYQEKIIQLTDKNKKSIIKDLRRYRFSIIPMNEIPAKAQTLFITKGIANAPNLKDLKGSKYEKSFQNYLDAIINLKVYNIGNEVAPYLASLKGFKVIEMHKGNIKNLVELLESKTIPKIDLPIGHIPIHESQVTITLTSPQEVGNNNGPDHLMRLHHYNKIMNQIGPEYFKSSDYPETGELVELAKDAHVLSPVSSMIVLETIKDYERFDIEKSKNSLGNAAMQDSGSIPEPHEWLLIILALGAVIFLKLKSRV
jgi:XrtN system VIT domain protein